MCVGSHSEHRFRGIPARAALQQRVERWCEEVALWCDAAASEMMFADAQLPLIGLSGQQLCTPPAMSLSPPLLETIPRACLAPVTEMLFVRDGTAILAASGSSITLYALATGRVIDQIQVFSGQRIHGMRLSEDADGQQLLIVFGGRSIAILQLNSAIDVSSSTSFQRIWCPTTTRSDLIWDAKLLRCNDAACPERLEAGAFDLAIGYAHDRVEVLAFKVQGQSLSPVADSPQYQCEDRSLLYSMHLHGSCRHQLMVIGGTVFSQLLIWNASVTAAPAAASSSTSSPTSTSSTRPILHRISGHEGVIFKLTCNQDATRICSVSDDRTVRLWKWNASAAASTSASGEVLEKASIPLSSLLSSSAGSYTALSCFYGHRSRVWRCVLLRSHPFLLSSSEDNSCLVWRVPSSSAGEEENSEPVARFEGQKGGLWALAVDEARGIAATGAGDASIRTWNIDKLLRKHSGSGEATSSSSADDKSSVISLDQWLPQLLDAPAEPAAAAEDTSAATPSNHNVANASATATKHKRLSKPPSVEYCREVVFNVPKNGCQAPTMYVVTSRGRIFSSQLDASTGRLGESVLLHHHTAATAAIVAVAQSPCNGWLAMGDQRGSLLLVSADSTRPQSKWVPAVHASALNFLMWMPPAHDDPASGEYTLLTADALNEVKLWRINTSPPEVLHLTLLQTFRLPVSKARLTCAVVVDLESGGEADEAEQEGEGEEKERFLVCGDSRGSVYAYYLPPASLGANEETSSSVQNILAVDRLPNVHEKAALTSLTVDPSSAHSGSAKIYSTATDGKVIEYVLSQAPKPVGEVDTWYEKHNSTQQTSARSTVAIDFAASFSLQRKRVHKLSTITLVKQVHFSSSSSSSSSSSQQSDILVSGFHANDFVLVNLTQNVQIRRWSCGGDKRSWAFHMLRSRQPPGDGGGGGKEGFLFCYARHGEEAGGKEGGAAVASALHSSAELVFHVQLPSAATSSDSTSSSAAVPSLGCAIHGRLTTSVAVVPLTPEACLIITGSEDNTIKLFSAVTPTASPSFTDASSTRTQLSCVATLVDHPDVVRSIAISPEQSSTDASPAASSSSTLKSIHLLFSGGGRDFLHCTRITADCRNSDQQQVTAAVESLGSTGGNVFTNMGRSFGPKRRVAASSVAASASSSSTSAGTAATQKTDVEELRMLKQDVRIMCLTAVPVPSEWMPSNLRATAYHLVVSGNSVGVIKFFLFDSTRHTFRLIAECLQHHYTLLSITQVVLGSEVLVFSGATDGCIRVWKVRELVESTLKADASSTASTTFDSIHSFPAHASGVDCLAVQPLASAVDGQPASSFRLFSGGDDESIHALTARFNSESGQLEHLATRSWPNSHNSAVKSLALLDSALFSVSYDQRLRVWTIPRAVETPDGESATVDLIPAGSTLLDVWDLSTVRVIPSSQSPSIEDRVSGSARSPLIVIAGQGLQLLQATAAAQR